MINHEQKTQISYEFMKEMNFLFNIFWKHWYKKLPNLTLDDQLELTILLMQEVSNQAERKYLASTPKEHTK